MKCNVLQCFLPFSQTVSERKTLQDAMLSYGLANFYNLDSKDFLIMTGPKGKPYLKGENSVYFNITNTSWNNKQYIAIAFAPYEVGIDIEHPRQLSPRLPEKILSPEEYKLYRNTSNQNSFLQKYWTLKEAYVKYTGEGLSCPPSSLSFYSKSGNEYGLTGQPSLYFYNFSMEQDLTLSLCTPVQTEIEFHIFT